VYDSAPFELAAEISGFFKLDAWIAIDQPDTDFRTSIYDVAPDGRVVLMASDQLRARYRKSVREENLIETKDPLRYAFDGFNFVSRRIAAGHRLRLVFGPVQSIYAQRNGNCGSVVSAASLDAARPVKVRLFHGGEMPSALIVPYGRTEDRDV
jgi:predicted acyl esterase